MNWAVFAHLLDMGGGTAAAVVDGLTLDYTAVCALPDFRGDALPAEFTARGALPNFTAETDLPDFRGAGELPDFRALRN